MQAETALRPKFDRQRLECESPSNRAAAAPRRTRIWRCIWRPPSQARSGFRADATAGSPRRRAGSAAAGCGNRRRPRPLDLFDWAADANLAAQRLPVENAPRPFGALRARALVAFLVAVKDEALRIDRPSTAPCGHWASSASTVASAMALGSFGSAFFRLGHPGRKESERLVSLVKSRTVNSLI